MVTQSNYNDTRNIYASSKKTRSKKELSRIAKEQYDIDLDEQNINDEEKEAILVDTAYREYVLKAVERSEERVRNGERSYTIEESRRLIYEKYFNE